LAAAVQSPLAGQGSPLIGDGNEPGPLRSRVAGAAELRPGCGSPVVERIVDRKTGIGVGVVGDVRVRPQSAALRDHALLVGRLRLDRANAAAAAAPTGFAEVVARGVDVEGRAADG